MTKNIVINEDLWFLEHILFLLDNYKFDEDIIKILIQLKNLVDKKIYQNYNLSFLDYYNVINQKLLVQFNLKNIR